MLFNLVYKPAEDADKEMEIDTRIGGVVSSISSTQKTHFPLVTTLLMHSTYFQSSASTIMQRSSPPFSF